MLSLTGASLVTNSNNNNAAPEDSTVVCSSLPGPACEELVNDVLNNDFWHIEKSIDELKDVVWYIGRNGTDKEFSKVLRDLKAVDTNSSVNYEVVLNGHGSDGYTIGHWCATRCEPCFLQDLMNIVPSYNLNVASLLDNSGMCPIHWAASIGSIYNVNFILREMNSGNSVEDEVLECRDKSGCTPLLVAAQFGHVELCAFLLKRGANVYAKDNELAGVLHWAAYNGWQNVIGLLCHEGWAFSDVFDLGDGDSLGHTALHLAALQGKSQVMQYMLEETWVRCKQNKEFVRDQILGLKDSSGKTALDLAIETKDASACRVILQEWEERCCATDKRTSLCKTTRALLRQLCSIHNWRLWLGLPPSNRKNMNNVEEASFYQQRAVSPMVLIIAIMTLCLLLFPYKFWARKALPLPSHIIYLHASTICSMVFMWMSFILTFKTDPGILANHCIHHPQTSPKDDTQTQHIALKKLTANLQSLYDKTLELYAHQTNQLPTQQLQLCHSCHIVRPLRSKHCRVQRRCVLLFDHYCPFVGNTIGLYNYPYFYFLLLFLTTSIVGFTFSSLHYLETFFELDVLFILLFVSPFFIPCFGMTIYHTCLAIRNLTTNEIQNWRRYSYLLDQKDDSSQPKYYNPFDLGIIQNLYMRFFPRVNECIQISNKSKGSLEEGNTASHDDTIHLHSKYGSTIQADEVSDNYVTLV